MKPNYFMNYVSDMPRAVAFYNDLFDMTPSFEAPGFVAYDLGGGAQFSLWSRRPEILDGNPVRTSEVGLVVHGNGAVQDLWDTWRNKGTIVEEVHDEPFGTTFVIADPDGNHIRVSPVD